MPVSTRFGVEVPAIFTQEPLFEAFLTSEIRGAMNEVMEEIQDTVKAKTVIFRGVTRRGWKRTEARRFGRGFIATLSNKEVTANILEYGAPDRFRGSTGFSRPPPIQSKTAGTGRTILDWVVETDPVLVDDIKASMSKFNKDRKAWGSEGQYSFDQQAARRAAYAVAGSIYARGLPSSSNRSSLLLVNRVADEGTQRLQERVAQAVRDTFSKLRLKRREF